ncbi:hypothetical protein [Clostridium amazonitimonense]|uniref:hypothetical protein n=1 Tax=Clostridium amazonitimonense TaxID=1499689 RepID=UPI00050998EE|nr:hypothetical protein [Clostridium amazonitimonense]
MNDKYIYLVFSKTGTWLSKMINLITSIKYAHSSISLDNSFKKMYSFGRINPNNPFLGGFVEENLHEGVYKKFTHSECLIYKVKVTEEQLESLKNEIDTFSKEKNKYRYNFLGLFFVLLNLPIKRKCYYFCSQFVSEALIKSNIYKSDKTPELIKTTDLFSINNKEIIYEGPINKYYVNDKSYSVI